MKKNYQLLLCLLFCTWFLTGQIIINKGIYKVNFSNSLHVPRYVSYMLYKGGGPCDRQKESFSFKNDMQELQCAKTSDYTNSGYEKGHLANAEDFAFDCENEELTFRYYNCIPQTTSGNHSHWLHYEGEIRKWSQKEKLYIICGGYFKGKKIGKNKDIAVPEFCWKVVQSVKTKKVLFCGIFTNTATSKLIQMTIPELETKLKAKIVLIK